MKIKIIPNTKWEWARLLLICFVILIVIHMFLFSGFGGTSVCRICGAEREENRFFGIQSYNVKDTLLSKFVTDEQIVESHTHIWLFGQGAGGEVTCAIGQGRHLFWAVNNREVIDFLNLVNKYEGKEKAKNYLEMFLNPDRTMDVRTYLLRGPEDIKLDSKEKFDKWLSDKDKECKEMRETSFSLHIEDYKSFSIFSDQDILKAINSMNMESGKSVAKFSPMGSGYTYIQCTGDSKNGFTVEYWDGDINYHYKAKRHFNADETVKILSKYRIDDLSWKSASEWESVKTE